MINNFANTTLQITLPPHPPNRIPPHHLSSFPQSKAQPKAGLGHLLCRVTWVTFLTHTFEHGNPYLFQSLQNSLHFFLTLSIYLKSLTRIDNSQSFPDFPMSSPTDFGVILAFQLLGPHNDSSEKGLYFFFLVLLAASSGLWEVMIDHFSTFIRRPLCGHM